MTEKREKGIERLTFVSVRDVIRTRGLLKEDTHTCPSDECKSLTVVIITGAGVAEDKHTVIVVLPTEFAKD